jgi:hypothetical protein
MPADDKFRQVAKQLRFESDAIPTCKDMEGIAGIEPVLLFLASPLTQGDLVT